MSAPVVAHWPALDYAAWRDTGATLHRWSQIVGKVRLALTPWLNHGWHVPLYVTARGLGTSAIHVDAGVFEIELDVVAHRFVLRSSFANERGFALEPMSVAAFYRLTMAELAGVGIEVSIDVMPNEIADAVPFPEDTSHASYDAAAVSAFWHAIVRIDRVFREFRTGFLGKSSPVHFFWGSFDLAVTRFSGRRAPLHPGGVPGLPDAVTREAYSHEVSSAGFWPGSDAYPHAAFYSYAYPKPARFEHAAIEPEGAFWSAEMGEWLLPYDAVQHAHDPSAALLRFLDTTYRAAAGLAQWDDGLVCGLGTLRRPRPVLAQS